MKMNISKCHIISFLDLLSRIDLDELMKKDEPPLDFPDTLEGFEYAFNESKYILCMKNLFIHASRIIEKLLFATLKAS